MSEQQNLEVVRQGYAAFVSGDIPGLLSLLDGQVSWVMPGPSDLPIAGTRQGQQEVGEFFQAVSNLVDILRFEPKDFIAQGERVVVLGDDTARVKATGRNIEYRWAHVFRLRDGKIVAFEEFGDVSALVAEVRSAQARV